VTGKSVAEEKPRQRLTDRPDRRLCRFCDSGLNEPFLNLGTSPLANSYLRASQLNQPEPFYPLRVYVCPCCFLVQLEQFETPEHIFSDYAYFSSYSDSWLQHARNYVEMAAQRFSLDESSQVVEIASNDGYLLQYFARRGVGILGIEPAANVAKAAIEKGIPTLIKFFGEGTARDLVAGGRSADLVVGNNVLAHVPGLNDFVEGLRILLKPQGVVTLEFPHLMRLIEENQFDTIYHEHFSYFSLTVAERVFSAHGLKLFDVDELPTHGGSLRVYLCHAGDSSRQISRRVAVLKDKEDAGGLNALARYSSFGEQVRETKRKLLEFLIRIKRQGKSVVGYGAPAKGNTLLNYCGIRSDFIDYTVDRSPEKQGCFLPGTQIPICHPSRIMETKPDYLLILPWNLKDEIMEQMSGIRAWGGRFVVPIPETRVYS
jgi:2-polyprenyl-3-methyl-5-hydroxy-6-metoxy-1,4-benzoquinol methylase